MQVRVNILNIANDKLSDLLTNERREKKVISTAYSIMQGESKLLKSALDAACKEN